ncbi:TPA: ash family protein [Yersinia enterocolitica]|nr:ash family protein [Yersinia enterocolitica]HEI6777820.1 ash family protein [Yersinia enterocolitica]HEI6840675.1 ash family protein [Yersinia enterocolitica]HEI6878491.1 ash family protein [Yersinia enterocolitica]HEI6913207.1 ash family protein [Yersinia enterocolitica]
MSCTYKNRLPNTMTGRYISPAAAKSAVGFRSPDITKAHDRASGFFMRKAQPHLRTMVGRAGALFGAPGSLVSGTANPVRLTTLKSFAALGGELIQTTKEVASWRQSIPSLAHNSVRKPAANSIALNQCSPICLQNSTASKKAHCSNLAYAILLATCVAICAISEKKPASSACCRTHLKTSTISSQGVLPPLAREMT